MLGDYIRGLVDLVFPTTCYACQAYEPLDGHLLCAVCLEDLPWIATDAAPAALEGKDNFPSNIQFFDGLLYFTKSSPTQQLISEIKYNGQRELAHYLGLRLASKIESALPWHDYEIIPVPIHKKRRRLRGYNQAEELARPIAAHLGIPINISVLKRNHFETSQTQKGKRQRASVMQKSFSLVKSSTHIHTHTLPNALLIDDVITTGATIKSCVALLRTAGYKQISVISLAISI